MLVDSVEWYVHTPSLRSFTRSFTSRSRTAILVFILHSNCQPCPHLSPSQILEVFYSPFRERLLLDINPFLLLCVRHIVLYRPMSKLCLLCRGSSRARATASVPSIYPSEVFPASILVVGLYSAYLRLNAVPCASSPQKGESQLRFSGSSALCLSIAVCAVLLTSAVVVCYKLIGSDK